MEDFCGVDVIGEFGEDCNDGGGIVGIGGLGVDDVVIGCVGVFWK